MQAMQSGLSQGQQIQPGAAAIDLPSMAQAQAKLIATLPKPQQTFAINNLRAQSPELASMVEQLLAQMQQGQEGGQAGQGAGPQVDMRPLPEQRSPRRAAGMV